MIFIELILWVIATMSALIAWEFYKSRDDRLRVLIISLFICKIWVYGGAAIFFLFLPPNNTALIRIIVFNLPMFIIMVRLWDYIRTHNH